MPFEVPTFARLGVAVCTTSRSKWFGQNRQNTQAEDHRVSSGCVLARDNSANYGLTPWIWAKPFPSAWSDEADISMPLPGLGPSS